MACLLYMRKIVYSIFRIFKSKSGGWILNDRTHDAHRLVQMPGR